MIARSPQHASAPGESGPGTLPGTEGRKGVGILVRRFGPSILINGVAPYFIYFVLHHQFQVAELPALVATSIRLWHTLRAARLKLRPRFGGSDAAAWCRRRTIR